MLYGARKDAPLLELQSSYKTLQLISNGQIVDLQTFISMPSTALEENRHCVYLRFEEITTYDIVVTLQCSDHNASFPLIFNSISASKDDSMNSLHDGSRNKITRNVSEAIILSSEIHEFKESVLFQFDFGDGVVAINESQSGLTEAKHHYLQPGIFNITSTAIFKDDNLCMIGKSHQIKAYITLVDDSRSYLKPKTIISELNPDTQRVISDAGEVTYKQVYDELLSHNQSERKTVISIKRRSVEPDDLLHNASVQYDNESPAVAKAYSCFGRYWLTAGSGERPVIVIKNVVFRIALVLEVFKSLKVSYSYNSSVMLVNQDDLGVNFADFRPLLATPAYISMRITPDLDAKCWADTGMWIDTHEPFDKYSLDVTSKDQFLINTPVEIHIKATGLDRFDIYYNVSCDGKKLASVFRRPYSSASRYQTKFITVGRHFCESRAYIKGMPGRLEGYTAPGTNTTVRKYFCIITKPITIFKYDIKLNGTSLASSSKPHIRQTFLPVFENIAIYFICDGYNTTFSFIVYPYQDDDARLTAKKHYIVGEWNATSQTASANFTYSSNSLGLFTIELQADNVFSRKVSNITANFRKRITPFEIQLSFYQKIRTVVRSDSTSYSQKLRLLVRFNLTSHNGDFISYHWKIGAGFSKVTRTATLLHTFNTEISLKNVSVCAFNNLSSYSISKSIFLDIRGLQATWNANSFVLCFPTVIQIRGVAKGGKNTICNITSGSRTLHHDIARPRASRGEMLACNTTLNLTSFGFYNFTVTMYNSVIMSQVQVRSIEGIQSNPFKVSMTSATSTVETDAVFITTGDFLCPLHRCNFDFGDGTKGTFQLIINGSSVRHRYRKIGHYKVSGMLKIYLLRYSRVPNTMGGRLLISNILSNPRPLLRLFDFIHPPRLLILAKQCPKLNMIFIRNFVRKINHCSVLVN